MTAHLEVRSPDGSRMVALEGERLTVGRDDDNEVPLPADRRVSRVHAAFEQYSTGWCVHDLGSRNGTFVNNERVWRERVLHDGDEVRVGETALTYRADRTKGAHPVTEGGTGMVRLTPREYEVLVSLCVPLLSGDLFTEPASTREVAETLVITEAAVKQHLLHLYDKLGIHDGERRRARLANESFRRGVISLGDLRSWVDKRQAEEERRARKTLKA
ncbi:MAG TPA: FHA domain-containing protein [Actinomycetes bacterium]|nr:FHA domain-containing protein [Actinomycetes bacterium]